LASYVTAAFYGLLVLVPAAKNDSADVVAVNGTVAGVEAHTPRLAIDASKIKYQAGDATADDYFVAPDGRRFAVWNISHTEVSFLRTTAGFSVTDKIGDFKDDAEDPGNDWNDLHWLGNASRASADKEIDEGRFVDSDYLIPHAHLGTSCASPTDALIRLTSGTISVPAPKSDELKMYSVKFSGDNANDYKRSLSDYFQIRIDFQDAPVLALKPFGGAAHRIHFVDGVNPEVVFSSLPSAKDKHAHEKKTEIDHFQAYYALLKDPLRRRKAEFGRGISSTECPPAVARRAN